MNIEKKLAVQDLAKLIARHCDDRTIASLMEAFVSADAEPSFSDYQYNLADEFFNQLADDRPELLDRASGADGRPERPRLVEITVKDSNHGDSVFRAYRLDIDGMIIDFDEFNEVIRVNDIPVRLMDKNEVRAHQIALNRKLSRIKEDSHVDGTF